MPHTTNFEFGQIVLVRFPFTDQRGSKQRPAVVISSNAYNEARSDVILMTVTSQVRTKQNFGEVIIDNEATEQLNTARDVLFKQLHERHDVRA